MMDRNHTITHFTHAMMNNNPQIITNASLSSTLQVQPEPTATERCVMDNSSLQVPLALFYTLFFLCGLAGNALALWVFVCVHSKKNSVRVFLINLALADILLAICLPFRVAYHFNNDRWLLEPALCRIVGTIFYMNMYISIVLLGLISVDRYLKFQRASCRQMFLQSSWSVCLCCCIWTFAFVAIIPLIIQTDGSSELQKCFQYKTLQNSKWKAYFNLLIVAMFWVVYGALVISYGRIGMKLLRVSKEKPDFPNAAKYNRTALKSFFVLFLFTVCFVPYHSVRIFYIMSQLRAENACSWINVMDKTNEIVLLLSALNSCLDPVMYFLLCGSVRRAILQMVCNISCQKYIGGQSVDSSDTPHEQTQNCTKPRSSRSGSDVV